MRPYFCISVQAHRTKTLLSESSIASGSFRINGKGQGGSHKKLYIDFPAEVSVAVSIEDACPSGSTSGATYVSIILD